MLAAELDMGSPNGAGIGSDISGQDTKYSEVFMSTVSQFGDKFGERSSHMKLA